MSNTSSYSPYRIAMAQYIDSLFYERGDARRYHNVAHELIVHQVCGVCKQTYWGYLRKKLAGYTLRIEIRHSLRILVTSYKVLPANDVEVFLNNLCQGMSRAIQRAERENRNLNAERLREYLVEALEKHPHKPVTQLRGREGSGPPDFLIQHLIQRK